MRYLLFSDIHGNVEALAGLIDEIESLRPDIIVSLGDVVGYGASPADCIDIVEEYAHIRISGNHDLVAAGLEEGNDFNPTAKQAIDWTIGSLDAAHRELLETYDPIRRYDTCVFAHASPLSPLDWEYIYTVRQAERIFEHISEKFIFIGHTHVPGVIAHNEKNGCRVIRSNNIELAQGTRYLINVGSIGQPRDGIAAASYALLDMKKGRLVLRRISYDIEMAQRKIRSVGLPESLALRLATAR
jgi:diadenosine tetraphosphatase ApaH/serine/threonine PP2A family protein phosphatase